VLCHTLLLSGIPIRYPTVYHDETYFVVIDPLRQPLASKSDRRPVGTLHTNQATNTYALFCRLLWRPLAASPSFQCTQLRSISLPHHRPSQWYVIIISDRLYPTNTSALLIASSGGLYRLFLHCSNPDSGPRGGASAGRGITGMSSYYSCVCCTDSGQGYGCPAHPIGDPIHRCSAEYACITAREIHSVGCSG
jgi:hypothetical protein